MKLNILIDQDRHARLADFGLLTIISDHTNFTSSSSASTGGTTRWMSPELLHPEQFGLDHGRPTKESDRYALGMVILEVLTGRPPFTPWKEHIVTQKVMSDERPARPEGPKGTWFTDDLWKMLGLCWVRDAQSRPSIDAVRECLERVSGTWEPLPPRVDEGAEDEDDWNLTLLTVWIFDLIPLCSCACGRTRPDNPTGPLTEIGSQRPAGTGTGTGGYTFPSATGSPHRLRTKSGASRPRGDGNCIV